MKKYFFLFFFLTVILMPEISGAADPFAPTASEIAYQKAAEIRKSIGGTAGINNLKKNIPLLLTEFKKMENDDLLDSQASWYIDELKSLRDLLNALKVDEFKFPAK